MKAYEINAIANAAIAELMADGYVINVLNKIHRNDSVILIKRNGSKQDIRMVKIEERNEWSHEKNYDLGTITVSVYEFNGLDADFSGVLWEDRANNVVEVAKFYTAKDWGRNKWYTSLEEAIERQNKMHARREARRTKDATVQLNAESVSDNMLEKIRSIRGFKRANRNNMTIEKRGREYKVGFDFTSKFITVSNRGVDVH